MNKIVEIKGPMKFNAENFSQDEIDQDMDINKWERIARALWKLLDDIDTASDVFKPEMNPFFEYTMNKVEQRFRYMTSDGYDLFPVKEEGDD